MFIELTFHTVKTEYLVQSTALLPVGYMIHDTKGVLYLMAGSVVPNGSNMRHITYRNPRSKHTAFRYPNVEALAMELTSSYKELLRVIKQVAPCLPVIICCGHQLSSVQLAEVGQRWGSAQLGPPRLPPQDFDTATPVCVTQNRVLAKIGYGE